MLPVDRLIVALDVPTREAALDLVRTLRPKVRFYKIGLELFTACGPALVREVLGTGAKVFLDLSCTTSRTPRRAPPSRRRGLGSACSPSTWRVAR